VHFTDLGIADELQVKEFRDQFFRTEREIDIPAQIKSLRKLRGITQQQLAEKVGTKQSAVSRLESGEESNWELETLVKHAEALDARLSVTFEPYEIVVARYKLTSRANEPSAATANTSSNQKPEPSPLTDTGAQRQEQEEGRAPMISQKREVL
jgi:transcriptional regulator with XRE-family HTH domain